MKSEWSLTPLTRILNAHSHLSRILWSVFSVTMVGGLIICIIFTVHQYLDHATVFRMDYSTSNYFNDLPAVTVCHNRHRITSSLDVTEGNLKSAVTYDLPASSSASWSTQTARSKLYKGLTNYTAHFNIDLPLKLKLTVVEQLPRPKNQICTTFELTLDKNQVWSNLDVMMNQANPTQNDYFEVVIHNKRSFPFDNYERYLYRRIDPGKWIYMFTAKSVTNHLNTFRNPCANTSINLVDIDFNYDQTVCQWQQMCSNLRHQCHCSCELDIVGIHNHPCTDKCLRQYSRALVNTTVCPQACHKTKYSDLNVVTMDTPTKEQSKIVIIMSNLVSIATEEPIYTLTKMFSEIGGLSSLLLGVSSIIVFELIEKMLHSFSVLKSSPTPLKHHNRCEKSVIEYNSQRSCTSESTYIDSRHSNSYPIEVNVDTFIYSTFLRCEESASLYAISQ